MICIVLILGSIQISQGRDTKTCQRIGLTINCIRLHHGTRHSILNGSQRGILSQDGILDLGLPLFDLGIAHRRLFIICQWIVTLSGICIVKTGNLIDDLIILSQKILDLVIKPLGIRIGIDAECLTRSSRCKRLDRQPIDIKVIG